MKIRTKRGKFVQKNKNNEWERYATLSVHSLRWPPIPFPIYFVLILLGCWAFFWVMEVLL